MTNTETSRERRPRRLTFSDVRSRLGPLEPWMMTKVHSRIDSYCRRFIAHSPFLAMATSDTMGTLDCSPRGDYPRFVKVLDERTLAIPDRPGNKIADSFVNIAENGRVGLLFMVPGSREVLRVNGRCYPTDEPDVLARMQVEGKDAVLALIVEVEEAFYHCGRAMVRSRLWDPAAQALAEELPSPGEVAAAQIETDLDAAGMTEQLESGYRRLY